MKRKKIISALILALVFMSQNLMAQEEINSTSLLSAQNQIIEQCLTFRPLIKKIPIEIKSQIVEYYISTIGVDVQLPSNFEVEGKRTSIISEEQITSNESYFLFNKISVDDDRSLVEYNFTYTSNGVENILSITAKLGIFNSRWSVMNYEISN